MVHGYSIYFCREKMKGKREKNKNQANFFRMNQPLTFPIFYFFMPFLERKSARSWMNVTDFSKVNSAYTKTDPINHTFTKERECIYKNNGFYPQ